MCRCVRWQCLPANTDAGNTARVQSMQPRAFLSICHDERRPAVLSSALDFSWKCATVAVPVGAGHAEKLCVRKQRSIFRTILQLACRRRVRAADGRWYYTHVCDHGRTEDQRCRRPVLNPEAAAAGALPEAPPQPSYPVSVACRYLQVLLSSCICHSGVKLGV